LGSDAADNFMSKWSITKKAASYGRKGICTALRRYYYSFRLALEHSSREVKMNDKGHYPTSRNKL
jgi:hypothetical protein